MCSMCAHPHHHCLNRVKCLGRDRVLLILCLCALRSAPYFSRIGILNLFQHNIVCGCKRKNLLRRQDHGCPGGERMIFPFLLFFISLQFRQKCVVRGCKRPKGLRQPDCESQNLARDLRISCSLMFLFLLSNLTRRAMSVVAAGRAGSNRQIMEFEK